MSHMHWVERQNKLELPNEEEEVNTRDIHKCDGQAHDPDTMAAPLTPKPSDVTFMIRQTMKQKKKDLGGLKIEGVWIYTHFYHSVSNSLPKMLYPEHQTHTEN